MSLAKILKKTTNRQVYISDSRWVLPNTYIGVEHEYEGVKNRTLPPHTHADFWTYHEEGSLRDEGAEFVFSTPLFGVDAHNALEWLVPYAKASGWKCSKRTGIHVHLDVRDLTPAQFAGMSLLYAAVEPILYRWVGDGRASSHFCIPLYRADEALLGVCKIIRSALSDEKGDSHNALAMADVYQRYAGYNLQALAKFGSVEFRQLQTTHDLDRIRDWINMIMSLKAGALRLPESDGATVRMLQRMSAVEMLNYIFPADLARKLYTEHSEREFLQIGLPCARDVAVHGCTPTSWMRTEFPKGTNEGFAKWMKAAKAVRVTVDEDELEGFDADNAGEPLQADMTPVQERPRDDEALVVPAPAQIWRTADLPVVNVAQAEWRDDPFGLRQEENLVDREVQRRQMLEIQARIEENRLAQDRERVLNRIQPAQAPRPAPQPARNRGPEPHRPVRFR